MWCKKSTNHANGRCLRWGAANMYSTNIFGKKQHNSSQERNCLRELVQCIFSSYIYFIKNSQFFFQCDCTCSIFNVSIHVKTSYIQDLLPAANKRFERFLFCFVLLNQSKVLRFFFLSTEHSGENILNCFQSSLLENKQSWQQIRTIWNNIIQNVHYFCVSIKRMCGTECKSFEF